MIRSVVGYEGKYAIDSMGNVYSFPNKTHKSIKRLTPKTTKNQYQMVGLCSNGKVKDSTVHRLMAEAFLGPVDGLVVNHINGIRNDNRLENLELVSLSTNSVHGIYVLKNGLSKFTHEQAEEIKRRVANGEKQKDVARDVGASPQVINLMVKGVTYSRSNIVTKYAKEQA